MLILTRKTNEAVIVDFGDFQLEVVVCGIKEGKTRLGFKAPPFVPIHREEIYHRIKAGIDTVPANPVI